MDNVLSPVLTVSLDLGETLGLSVVVLLIGRYLVKNVSFLNNFCIPAPVVGGLLFSFLTLLGVSTNTFHVHMDETLRHFFMIAFFTTIGFGASWQILKKGGIAVIILLAVVTGLTLLQNVVGISIAKLFGVNPFMGIVAGSMSMTGGHGTAGAFGPTFENVFNVSGATTVGLAAATFGLIAGSLLGGPTARMLIKKHNLLAGVDAEGQTVDNDTAHDHDVIPLESPSMSMAFFQISIAMGIGSIVSMLINKTGLIMPPYIGSMLVAAAMRNICSDGGCYKMRIPEINSLGDIFLAIFLSQALMGLKLWELKDLALPLVSILIAQTVLMFLFAYFITFRVMGRDYDAAVISAGHCGFGMGATPNAIANMNAICNKYGYSPKAFFIIPLVGCLFIDVVNATVITTFANILAAMGF